MRTPPSSRRRGWRAFLVAALPVLISGCVYYNGVYNAKEAAHTGDARLRRGDESDAVQFFQLSAAKAESILVRHPTSKWRTRALYLAGRGAALAGQCESAMHRLPEFLTIPGSTEDDRARARVALASCELRSALIPAARRRLDSLIDAPNAEIARQARLWAARAALADGDRDAVARLLGGTEDGAMPWELLQSSLSAHEYVRVESLLVQRARRADYRDDVTRALREMFAAGRWDAVEAVVHGYDLSRVRDASRASMHFVVGDLNVRVGQDSVARQHLLTARTLAGRDTVIERESAARIAYLAMRRVSTLREVDTIVAREDSAVRRTPYARRLNEQLLLVRLLAQQAEPTGAAWFLAAEVARDSLRAPELARAMFLRVVREAPQAPLAPHALYAAGLLTPDSASVWGARIRRDFAGSSVAAWLSGADPAGRADFALTPDLLQLRWTEALRTWSDSVRKLRTPPKPTVPSTNRD
ncbi:MAG: hypothetical protein IPP90_18605 [Gemmatimonadaceae bacterium]|nr:hypothetical protein [Gemmatimonadaceae bacterium]